MGESRKGRNEGNQAKEGRKEGSRACVSVKEEEEKEGTGSLLHFLIFTCIVVSRVSAIVSRNLYVNIFLHDF